MFIAIELSVFVWLLNRFHLFSIHIQPYRERRQKCLQACKRFVKSSETAEMVPDGPPGPAGRRPRRTPLECEAAAHLNRPGSAGAERRRLADAPGRLPEGRAVEHRRHRI